MLDTRQPRSFTTDNMHGKPVQSLFNYATIDDLEKRERIRSDRELKRLPDYITLGQIYDAFENGQTFDEILNEIDGISPQSVLLGRAFYMAVNPKGYAGRRQQYLRVLCDENGDEMWEKSWIKKIMSARNGVELSAEEEAHIRKTIHSAVQQSVLMNNNPDILELPIRKRAEARLGVQLS